MGFLIHSLAPCGISWDICSLLQLDWAGMSKGSQLTLAGDYELSRDLVPKHLCVNSAWNLDLSQRGCWTLRQSKSRASVLRDPGDCHKAAYNLAPETRELYFCHGVLTKQVTKASPHRKGRDWELASIFNVITWIYRERMNWEWLSLAI